MFHFNVFHETVLSSERRKALEATMRFLTVMNAGHVTSEATVPRERLAALIARKMSFAIVATSACHAIGSRVRFGFVAKHVIPIASDERVTLTTLEQALPRVCHGKVAP